MSKGDNTRTFFQWNSESGTKSLVDYPGAKIDVIIIRWIGASRICYVIVISFKTGTAPLRSLSIEGNYVMVHIIQQ